MFDSRAEQAHWSTVSAAVPTGEEFEFLYNDMRRWVPGFPEVFDNKRVLDLGAGRGMLGVLVSARCGARQCTSLDLCFNRLGACSLWTRTLSNFGAVCGDALLLPFRDNSFDLVVANSILHHFPELDPVTAEIARVLRPGGRYIGREPNWDNPAVRTHVFLLDGTWLRKHATVTSNEYPLRTAQILGSFARASCTCSFAHFSRRWKYLRHPRLAIAVSVQAQKAA